MSAFWNERYNTDHYVFGETPNAFLATQVDIVRKYQTALAIADGEGRNGVWLAEQGLDVLALDSSSVGLEKSQRLAAKRGVRIETRLGDIAAYDWPENQFGLVVAIFIQFADPALRSAIFEGIRTTLRPGGTVILEGYRPEQIAYGTGGPRQVENLYTRRILEDAFSGFEILHLDEGDAEVREGTGHAGMSALIDLVARKPE
ncbi:MAG: class I SAM-dependent methyltransferase [Devosia sp.]